MGCSHVFFINIVAMIMDMPDMAGKPAENDYFAFSNNLKVIGDMFLKAVSSR